MWRAECIEVAGGVTDGQLGANRYECMYSTGECTRYGQGSHHWHGLVRWGPSGGERWQGTVVRQSAEALFAARVGGEVAIGSHREVSRVMCMIGCMVRQGIVVSQVAWIGVKACASTGMGVGLHSGSRIVRAASLGSMCGIIHMLIWSAGCATGDGVPFT